MIVSGYVGDDVEVDSLASWRELDAENGPVAPDQHRMGARYGEWTPPNALKPSPTARVSTVKSPVELRGFEPLTP